MQRRPDAREVWAAARRHLAMVAVNLPDPHVVLRGPALLLITGAPSPDFNMALLEAAPMAETILREFVALVRAADVPALFMLSSTTDTSLRAVAHEAGLSEAGSAPLMVLTDLPAVTAGRTDAFAVETVADPTRLAHVADLVAAGFGLDRDWVGRVFAVPTLLNAPGVTYVLASQAGEPYSTVTTTASQPGGWSASTVTTTASQPGGWSASGQWPPRRSTSAAAPVEPSSRQPWTTTMRRAPTLSIWSPRRQASRCTTRSGSRRWTTSPSG